MLRDKTLKQKYDLTPLLDAAFQNPAFGSLIYFSDRLTV